MFLLDQDQNRSINHDVFCTIAKSVGIELDSNEALSLIRRAIREQTDNQTQETELNVELRQTFDALDRDHDGRITREYFDKLRNKNSFFDHLDDGQYELLVRELLIQANHNNGIDFNQFVNLMIHHQ